MFLADKRTLCGQRAQEISRFHTGRISSTEARNSSEIQFVPNSFLSSVEVLYMNSSEKEDGGVQGCDAVVRLRRDLARRCEENGE